MRFIYVIRGKKLSGCRHSFSRILFSAQRGNTKLLLLHAQVQAQGYMQRVPTQSEHSKWIIPPISSSPEWSCWMIFMQKCRVARIVVSSSLKRPHNVLCPEASKASRILGTEWVFTPFWAALTQHVRNLLLLLHLVYQSSPQKHNQGNPCSLQVSRPQNPSVTPGFTNSRHFWAVNKGGRAQAMALREQDMSQLAPAWLTFPP